MATHQVRFVPQESPRLCWLASLQMLVGYETRQTGRARAGSAALLNVQGYATGSRIDRLASDLALRTVAKQLGLSVHALPSSYSQADSFGRVQSTAPQLDLRMETMRGILERWPFAMPCLVPGRGRDDLSGHVVVVTGFVDSGMSTSFYVLDPEGPAGPMLLDYPRLLAQYAPHGGVVYSCWPFARRTRKST